MTTNPFDPPRSTDLESTSPADLDELMVLEPAAVAMLLASGRWARMTLGAGIGWLVLLVLGTATALRHVSMTSGKASLVIGLSATGLTASGLIVAWRFIGGIARLERGEVTAPEAVTDAQRRLFRTAAIGVLLITLLTLWIAGNTLLSVTALSPERP